MNHAAATLIPAMFMVHVIVAIAITPSSPRRHRGGRPHTPKDRP